MAANLSPAHNFLGFRRQTLDAAGAPTYVVYNRFPIGGYLLIKLAILPFADDSSAQLYAARLLMLLCFTATAVLAYLSLARLTAHRWMALTATILAFSSAYCLYYNNMVETSVWPDLFGIFLVFHGMVLFVQEGAFPTTAGEDVPRAAAGLARLRAAAAVCRAGIGRGRWSGPFGVGEGSVLGSTCPA